MEHRRGKILIVDDVLANRLLLESMLEEDYEVAQADGGIAALEYLDKTPHLPLMVLLDILMPDLDGLQVLAKMRSNVKTVGIPVMLITASDERNMETRSLKAGAVDFIFKPFNPDVVKARVDNHIELKQYRDNLQNVIEQKVRHLIRSKENMLEALATVIEYRNLESGNHVKRTSLLASKLFMGMYQIPSYVSQLSKINAEVFLKAVPTHDIGKIGIPDNILLKPGKLTQEEFEVIKTHTTIGSGIVDTLLTHDESDEYLKHCRDICRYHHEKFDGSGYPDGLKGEEIPLTARIVTIIDVYDALMSSRIYKRAYTNKETFEIMLAGRGSQFDPQILDVFMGLELMFSEEVSRV